MARLVPAAAGALARAMDEVLDRRITQMVLPIYDVFDPLKCPRPLLPWLAWHSGLTHWSSAWPVATQRKLIQEAQIILRQRGTRAGVVRQLGAYNAAVQIVEWWEADPTETPGTWRVEVLLSSDVAVDAAAQDEIDQAIRRTAPLTRPWTIDVGLPASADILGGAKASVVSRYYLTGASVG